MILASDVITIFNKRLNRATKDCVWKPSVVTGASWYATQAETIDPNGGLKLAHKVIVRIPTPAACDGKDWVSPIDYDRAEDIGDKFTLRAGDVIVRAAVAGDHWTPDTLREFYDEVMTVLAVTDNRRARLAPHFKVVGP